MRRFVCVYAIFSPCFLGQSIHTGKDCIPSVRPELPGFEPTHPAEPWSISACIAQPAIWNIGGAQKKLHVESQSLPDDVFGQLDQFGESPAVRQKLPKSFKADGANPNAETSLLIPNTVADKRAHSQLIPLHRSGEIATVGLLQLVPASKTLVDLDRH